MSGNSQELLDSLERAVEDLESQSSVEVVVSFQSQCCNYRDVDLAWGLLFGLLTLGYKIWSPHPFDPDWVLPNVVLVGLLGYLLSRHLWNVRRLLVSGKRLEAAAWRAARAKFLELGINQTREHTGLLLFVARFERRLILVPDSGLQRQLSPAFWEEVDRSNGRADSDEALLQSVVPLLNKLKGPLQRQFPKREDDVNELPNRPVEAL